MVRVVIPPDGLTEGPDSLALAVVEFGSVYCPLCRRFHTTVFPALSEYYLRAGRAKYRYIELDADSALTAMLGLVKCATRPVGFERAMGWTFEHGPEATLYALAAKETHQSESTLRACADTTAARHFDAHGEAQAALSLDVYAIPTFIIGALDSTGCLIGWPYVGVPPLDTLTAHLDRAAELLRDWQSPLELDCG